MKRNPKPSQPQNQPSAQIWTPVLYVLDDEGEANGTIRYYCSDYCRAHAEQTNEDPVSYGNEPIEHVLATTRCEKCGIPVDPRERGQAVQS